MYEDDLLQLDTDDLDLFPDDELDSLDDRDFESPLDAIAPLEPETSPPDPEAMLLLLESEDPQQRMLAARAFCEMEDDRAIGPLLRLLQDTCPLTRVSAAYALGRNPSPETVEPLIDRLRDWNGYVRKGVVWALGNSADARALPSLLHSLKTDIPGVRLWAASSLGQMGSIGYEAVIATVPPLIAALRLDKVSVVRSNCAWSIGQLSRDLPSNVVYATAIDALIETMVEDEDMSVREDAKASLLKVGDPRALQMIEALQQDGLLW